jgi:hypothetical protein
METKRLYIGLISLLTAILLAACRSSQELTVEAGGFSFRPVAGFAVSIKGPQVTVTSRDEKINFILAGRSSCEVKPLEDVIDGFVSMFARDFEEFEANEPHSIGVAGKAAVRGRRSNQT